VAGFLFDEPRAVVESLLFVATEPLDVQTISELVGISPAETKAILDRIRSELESPLHGIQLVELAGGFQLCTKPGMAPYVEKLYHRNIPAISQAALETLAIIAYKQPVTRAEIEEIRGVKVDSVLTTLMERGMITEVGRKDGPGRPILYGTTREFLKHFGLKDISELPKLPAPESTAGLPEHILPGA